MTKMACGHHAVLLSIACFFGLGLLADAGERGSKMKRWHWLESNVFQDKISGLGSGYLLRGSGLGGQLWGLPR